MPDKIDPFVAFRKLSDPDKLRVIEAMESAARLIKIAKKDGTDVTQAGKKGVAGLKTTYLQNLALVLTKHKLNGVSVPSYVKPKERRTFEKLLEGGHSLGHASKELSKADFDEYIVQESKLKTSQVSRTPKSTLNAEASKKRSVEMVSRLIALFMAQAEDAKQAADNKAIDAVLQPYSESREMILQIVNEKLAVARELAQKEGIPLQQAVTQYHREQANLNKANSAKAKQGNSPA